MFFYEKQHSAKFLTGTALRSFHSLQPCLNNIKLLLHTTQSFTTICDCKFCVHFAPCYFEFRATPSLYACLGLLAVHNFYAPFLFFYEKQHSAKLLTGTALRSFHSLQPCQNPQKKAAFWEAAKHICVILLNRNWFIETVFCTLNFGLQHPLGFHNRTEYKYCARLSSVIFLKHMHQYICHQA